MNLFRHNRPAMTSIFVCLMLVWALLAPNQAASAQDPVEARHSTLMAKSDLSYENATIVEDVTWSGTVLVNGGVVIAPQATVRIEPGTVVSFTETALNGSRSRLVVRGRLQSDGTQEKPVRFISSAANPAKGTWGGILFLATEKRNQLDYTRIENAETAIETHFSTLAGMGVTVSASRRGVALRDSTVTLSSVTVSGCDTGLEVDDTELDIRGGNIADNRIGIAARRASLVLSSLLVRGNERLGVAAEECRLKLSGCEFIGNGVGALLKEGEGQLTMNRFTGNRDAGLRLSSARVRVNRNVISDNVRDGLQVEGGHSAIWDNAFSGNGGYNLANTGREDISAMLNWWGGSVGTAIRAKLLDAVRDNRVGRVTIAPWLDEKPLLLPEGL